MQNSEWDLTIILNEKIKGKPSKNRDKRLHSKKKKKKKNKKKERGQERG
jgi:hypothetical protein